MQLLLQGCHHRGGHRAPPPRLHDGRHFLDEALTHPDTLALPAERRQAAHALIDVLDDQLRTLIDLGSATSLLPARPPRCRVANLQRLHLAAQLRSGLFGAHVLD